MRIPSLLQFLVLAVAFVVLPARAAEPRNVDATSFGDSIFLSPEWLFHPGDDPQWASPTFDDHDWTVVSAQRPLTSYGFRDMRYGWYRMHLRLRPGAPAPLVALQGVTGSYEVFANGVRIGSHGRMDGNDWRLQERVIGFALPAQSIGSGGDLVLALRFAVAPVGYDGPGTSVPISNNSHVALASSFAYAFAAEASAARQTFHSVAIAALALLIAIVAFSLGVALRDRGEYIAAGVYLLASAAMHGLYISRYAVDQTFSEYFLLSLMTGLAYVALIEFVRLVVRQRRRRWIVVLETVSFLCCFSALLGGAAPTQFLYRLGFFLYFLPPVAVNIVLLVLLARALRGGSREARFLLPAVLIDFLPTYWWFGAWSLYYLHITPILRSGPSWTVGPYWFSPEDVCTLVFLASILIFLVLRTLRIARRNAEVGAELEAARATQQLLLARSTEPTPGFDVQSVYVPASEVGGDFFAVQAAGNGSLLVAVGDVSGKGIQAALTVSEILGALRGCTECRPAAILQYLNRVLRNRKGGFVTCCIALIACDGEIAIANAGHLSPYRDGEELEVDPGLPLGIVEDASWPESVHSFGDSERLTFISDGVVEARSTSGELYGFERMRAISMRSAQEIASEARAFGQEDDITVLTIGLASVPAVR